MHAAAPTACRASAHAARRGPERRLEAAIGSATTIATIATRHPALHHTATPAGRGAAPKPRACGSPGWPARRCGAYGLGAPPPPAPAPSEAGPRPAAGSGAQPPVGGHHRPWPRRRQRRPARGEPRWGMLSVGMACCAAAGPSTTLSTTRTGRRGGGWEKARARQTEETAPGHTVRCTAQRADEDEQVAGREERRSRHERHARHGARGRGEAGEQTSKVYK